MPELVGGRDAADHYHPTGQGRKLGKRCTVKVKKGTRYTLTLVKKRLSLMVGQGQDGSTTGLAPGKYTVRVIVRDGAGNLSTISTVILTVQKQSKVKAKHTVHRL